MAATIIDVAKRAGVSATTVSRILKKRYDLYPQPTIEKVLRAAKALRYVPNVLAQSLLAGRSNTIGVYGFFEAVNPVSTEFLLGILRVLQKTEHGTLIANLSGEASQDRKILHEIARRKSLCGMIISSFSGFRKNDFRLLNQAGLALALLENFHPDADSVTMDNQKGGALAAEYLIQKGYKTIALVMGTRRSPPANLRQRQMGFEKTLSAAGLSLPTSRTFYAPLYSFEDGKVVAVELLKSREKIQAVFCAAGDAVAIGLIRGLHELGSRVPEDLAVVGYDDLTMARYVNPPLTTVHQPLLEAGEATARCILQQLEKKRDGNTQHIVLQPRLVVRQSA